MNAKTAKKVVKKPIRHKRFSKTIMKPTLYLTSTPIGNYDDITLRALDVLKSVDFIVCEEFKEARRLLAHYGIKKELFSVNEHNEKETAHEVIDELKKGKSAALISDCGTPLFSDPGHLLVDLCIANKIEVVPLPGASSLMPALTASGLDIEKFYYYGWLSPKFEIRKKELLRLKGMKELIVLLDTPYRLQALLSAVANIFGKNKHVVLAYQITMKTEKFYRGPVSQIIAIAEKQNLKGEFVLLVDNR